jgi:anti-sigma B factor antagonist
VILLNIYEIEGVIVISAPRNLDIETAKGFKETSFQLCEKSSRGVVLDLRETEYIDSLGVGSIVSVLNHCTARGKKIAIVILEGEVKKILSMTHIDELIDTYENITKALDSMK